MTIFRRTTTTITTTTTVEEIPASHLNLKDLTTYELFKSPYGNPERELLKKITAVQRKYGLTEEEATHGVLHDNLN